jgi:hypothetical protein
MVTPEQWVWQDWHNHILTLVCWGMDQVLDQARAMLEWTPAPIQEVFGC